MEVIQPFPFSSTNLCLTAGAVIANVRRFELYDLRSMGSIDGMDIRLLGPLIVEDRGAELPLGGMKQRGLFTMLALRMNDRVGIGTLITGLWEDKLPDHPRRAIQVYASRLRALLYSAPRDKRQRVEILYHGDGYTLVGDPEISDFNRFQRMAAEGYALWPRDPDGTRIALHRALAQWRGDPLQEFVNEPFAGAEAARLLSLRWAALDLRVESDLACGRHRQVVAELEELTRCFPVNERLHTQLMIALYRSMRPAEALEIFHRLRESLVRELAIEPSESVQRLHRAILERSPDLVRPGQSSSWSISTAIPVVDREVSDHPTQTGPTDNLPPRVSYFVGRENILVDLTESARAGHQRRFVHVLHGTAGVGKTQIALEVAHRVAPYRPFRWWIDAEVPGLIPQQYAELGRAIGLRFHSGAKPWVRVLDWLSRRADWLIAFDNAAEPAAISRFLPTGNGMVLVTSRRRGWGELGSITYVDVMARTETVALLQKRIEHLDISVADRIAEEIGDLPLAAAQIASYIDQTDTDPNQYLEMFRRRKADLLGRGDVLGYPYRVDSTWTLSLDQLRVECPAGLTLMEASSMLAPDEIPLWLFEFASPKSALSCLRDSATTEDALASLVTYSLAQRRPADFRVHRLLQDVVRTQMDPTRRRLLADAVADMLVSARPGPPDQAGHWARFRTISPHLLAAQVTLESTSGGRRLLLDMANYLSATGDPRATRSLLTPILERWVATLGGDHFDVLQLTGEILYLTTWTGPADRAARLGESLLGRVNRVCGLAHPIALAAAAHYVLALAWSGRADIALEIGQSTVDRASSTLGPDHPTTVLALANTTSAHGWRGEHLEACRVGEQAYERASRSLGPDHALTLHAAAMLSYAELWIGKIEHAHRLALDSYDRAIRAYAGDHSTTLWLGSTLAFAQIRLGLVDDASRLADDVYRRAVAALGADHTVALVAGSVNGLAALRVGDFDRMRAVAKPTWDGLVNVHGVEHPISLGAATTLCLGAAASDPSLSALVFAWDTSARSDRIFGVDHPNSINARRAAEVLAEGMQGLKAN